MLMVKAGPAVDAVIGSLVPMLDDGDIIIDGGNSQFSETIRRTSQLEEALVRGGRSLRRRRGPGRAVDQPGGSDAAWPFVKDILQDIARR